MTALDADLVRREFDSRGPVWLASRLGIALRHGRAKCPIHRGESPESFAIYERRDGSTGWTCHSLCGSGDALALVGHMHRLDSRRDFRRVLELAADMLGGVAIDTPIVAPKRETPTGPDVDACRVFAAFVAACPLGGDALDYLRWTRKCWTRDELFAPATRLGVGYFWPDSLAKTAEAVGSELTERYLPRWSEWATHPLVLPITDSSGRVVAVQGRSIDPQIDKRHRFTGRGPAKLGFFGGRDLASDPGAMVVLTEGAIDALTMRFQSQEITEAWGPHIAIGRAGASGGLAAEQVEQLRGRHVLIAYDGDDAGKNGRNLAAEALRGVAKKVEWLAVPDGMDLAEVEATA